MNGLLRKPRRIRIVMIKPPEKGRAGTTPLLWRSLWSALLLTALLAPMGCGRKELPVAPSRLKLQAVEDLSADREGCSVILRWTIPKGGDNDLLTGFTIYRSEQKLSGRLCPDCPLTFQRVDRVDLTKPAPSADAQGQAVYRATTECGSRYFYKVVGFTGGDVRSADSNVVRIEMESPEGQ